MTAGRRTPEAIAADAALTRKVVRMMHAGLAGEPLPQDDLVVERVHGFLPVLPAGDLGPFIWTHVQVAPSAAAPDRPGLVEVPGVDEQVRLARVIRPPSAVVSLVTRARDELQRLAAEGGEAEPLPLWAVAVAVTTTLQHLEQSVHELHELRQLAALVCQGAAKHPTDGPHPGVAAAHAYAERYPGQLALAVQQLALGQRVVPPADDGAAGG